VLLGSGVTVENVSEFYDTADGFIVGSYFKEGGLWSNTVERARVERLTETVRHLRDGERPRTRGASDH
jgi:predicted TIM-barrel enzyme